MRSMVLVGLPGSGKSTAGRIAADLLDLPFTDIDREIEKSSGRSVAELFEGEGEAAFRARERTAVRAAVNRGAGVVAPGGGWVAQPGALEDAANALVVYLTCSPAEAAKRLDASTDRPLLAGPDRERQLQELLSVREAHYLAADAVVDTDGKTPREVAEVLAALARNDGG